MYCVQCGVELAPAEEKCPLCQTPAYKPQLTAPRLYPEYTAPDEKSVRYAWLYLITFLFLSVIGTCLFVDLTVNGSMDWAGYVAFSLLAVYCAFFVSRWFTSLHPMILTAIIFASIVLLLLYVNQKTHGHWFLTFGFPVAGAIFLLVELIIFLARFTNIDALYIGGISCCLMGGFCVLLELLISLTFGIPRYIWSFFPLIGLVIIGIVLFIIAENAALREALHKRFFL